MATNARSVHQTVHRLRAICPATEREISGELTVCAELIARRQRILAPKFRTLMAMGVRVDAPTPLVRDIGPTANYAAAQEEGVRPGGRGLPRFSDPESADIVAWLRTKVLAGRRVRRNSMAGVLAELELRDRYEGLAWHIRHKGVKATPFIGKALDGMRGPVELRLQAAAERGLRAGSEA